MLTFNRLKIYIDWLFSALGRLKKFEGAFDRMSTFLEAFSFPVGIFLLSESVNVLEICGVDGMNYTLFSAQMKITERFLDF